LISSPDHTAGFVEEDVLKAKELWKAAAARKHKLAFIALQRAKEMDAVPKSMINLDGVPPPSDAIDDDGEAAASTSATVTTTAAPVQPAVVAVKAPATATAPLQNSVRITPGGSHPAPGGPTPIVGQPTLPPDGGRRCTCSSDSCVIC